MNLVNDIVEQLRISVIFDEWYEGNDHYFSLMASSTSTPKSYCLFDRDALHSTVTYDYKPELECEPIIKWLKKTQDGNWDRVQVLRAWLRSALSFRHTEICRNSLKPGKSGKSTYANLAHALVGDDTK